MGTWKKTLDLLELQLHPRLEFFQVCVACSTSIKRRNTTAEDPRGEALMRSGRRKEKRGFAQDVPKHVFDIFAESGIRDFKRETQILESRTPFLCLLTSVKFVIDVFSSRNERPERQRENWKTCRPL